MAPEFLCIGHACYDLSVGVPGYPQENSKTEIGELLECGGGPAANAACLLVRWEVPCAFAGLIGNDLYGQKIAAEFVDVGVDCSMLELRKGHATPLSLILVNQLNGSRTIINRKIPGASLKLGRRALKRSSPTVLLFDGHEPDAASSAMRAFPKATTILDAGSAREGTKRLAGKVDYLAASERFALQIAGLSNLGNEPNRRACLKELRKRYSNTVIVTLGERGLIADSGEGYFHLPAFPAKVVDTTAAGDIFHGAFAYGIGQGMELKEALRLASMAASLSVRKAGGRNSIPPLAKVKEALKHA